MSAGSLMLARSWVRFPTGRPPELFPCLGLAPVYVDAHSERDDWKELRILLRLVRERGEHAPLAYGLTRPAALRVSSAGGAHELRAFGRVARVTGAKSPRSSAAG
jgi:hypothetical protein